jgi:hypothetical protein
MANHMANDDFWGFPMNLNEPTVAEVEEGARFVMSFTQFQRAALKRWLMGLALSWPMKYAAIMAYLKSHGFALACTLRKERAAAEARARYRGARERDLISKLIKGPIARKNKNFFTQSIALDERGRARLLPKNVAEAAEAAENEVEGRDPMAAGSRDPIPVPPPFRDDRGPPIARPPSESDNSSMGSMGESGESEASSD